MSERGKILGFGLLVLIVATVAVLAWWSREPSYRGRRLTSWLQQVYDTPLSETQRLSEAQSAVRAIGPRRRCRSCSSWLRRRMDLYVPG